MTDVSVLLVLALLVVTSGAQAFVLNRIVNSGGGR